MSLIAVDFQYDLVHFRSDLLLALHFASFFPCHDSLRFHSSLTICWIPVLHEWLSLRLIKPMSLPEVI
jgi:hypothetical protein